MLQNLPDTMQFLGLCDNGKSDISISAIIFYRFISINDIISIMQSAKNLVLSVSSSNLNLDKAGFNIFYRGRLVLV